MTRQTLQALLVVRVVLGAGCAGGITGDATPGDGSGPGDGKAADTGTVALYISDRPAAIEDFEHLTVTKRRDRVQPRWHRRERAR